MCTVGLISCVKINASWKYVIFYYVRFLQRDKRFSHFKLRKTLKNKNTFLTFSTHQKY